MKGDAIGPLGGIRVLDLSRTIAGVHATSIMADLGAEVIDIEQVDKAAGGISRGGMKSAIINGVDTRYTYQSRNKKSIALNLNLERGRALFYELVKLSDVIMENYRPGVTQRLGVDYDTLRRINPQLIYCSVTGFGESGPYRDRPCWDLIGQAFSGLMSVMGEPGRPPVAVATPFIDMTTAMNAAQAVLVALFWRERTGQGQRVQTTLAETGLSLFCYFPTLYYAGGPAPRATGSSLSVLSLSGAFKCQDGYLMTGVIHQRQWRSFCRALERTDLIEDPRFVTEERRIENREALKGIVQEELKKRTVAEWVERLNRENVAASRVNTMEEALEDPQVRHLGIIKDVAAPDGKPAKVMGLPFRLSAFPELRYRRAPHSGEHTEEVLSSLLGYTPQELESLRGERVI